MVTKKDFRPAPVGNVNKKYLQIVKLKAIEEFNYYGHRIIDVIFKKNTLVDGSIFMYDVGRCSDDDCGAKLQISLMFKDDFELQMTTDRHLYLFGYYSFNISDEYNRFSNISPEFYCSKFKNLL